MRSPFGVAIAVIVVALLAVIGVEHHQNTKLQAAFVAEAFAHDSAIATADTTRKLEAANFRAVLGDSTSLYQRRIVQVAQRADSIDRVLKLERVGKYSSTVRVAAADTHAVAAKPVVEDTSTRVRFASFDVRSAPYTVHANVALPAPPAAGRLDSLTVSVDPITVTARLSCGPAGKDGIRPASIEATTPAWASVQFNDVQQSPELCRSSTPKRSFIAFRPLVLGAGRAFATDRSTWALFVGTGLSFGGG